MKVNCIICGKGIEDEEQIRYKHFLFLCDDKKCLEKLDKIVINNTFDVNQSEEFEHNELLVKKFDEHFEPFRLPRYEDK